MTTSLKPCETAGIVSGALIFVCAAFLGGFALANQRRCHRMQQYAAKQPDQDPVEIGITGHVTAIQLARELAYQKAVAELEDYFEHESKTPDEAAFVKKTLDFLAATLAAIG